MSDTVLRTEKSQRDYRLVCSARDNGDQKAYAELLRIYYEPVRLMLIKMLKNSDEADDLTIETFTKAFSQLKKYSPTNAFSTWLFTIGYNTGIDFLRQKRTDTVPLSKLEKNEDDVVEYPIAADAPGPEELFFSNQRTQILRSVIAQLKPRYRTVIELRFFEELSYEEIAARLQLPMGTVKVHIKRARDLMYNIIINNEAMIKELHLNK